MTQRTESLPPKMQCQTITYNKYGARTISENNSVKWIIENKKHVTYLR